MRVLVTGAINAYGEAIVRELASRGHPVRAFGVPFDDDRYDGVANVKPFPGWVEVGGSLEPVLAEREALVHAACLDDPGKDKNAHAVRIERGTLYARYAAEREQVDHLIHLTPTDPGRAYGASQQNAVDEVHRTRGGINVRVLETAGEAAAFARQVADELEGLPMLGDIVGGNDNAVTA